MRLGFRKFKRKTALVAIVCMIMTLVPGGAFGLEASDISNHWAKDKIQSWVDQDLIKGYEDGTFKPDNNITRAEFMTLVNGSFGYTDKADIGFTDVAADAWYAEVVQKAKAAGYISGYPDNTMKPNNSISRAEAATIIKSITMVEGNPAGATSFTDNSALGWSKDAVAAVSETKIMNGYPDGSFKTQDLIKRGEAVVALDTALSYNKASVVYDKAGTYGPTTGVLEVEGDLIVLVKDVKLQNILIKGNLIVSKNVGDGNVTLDKVTVKGESRFYGGGENSIIIIDSTLGNVTVYKEDGKIRIVISGNTTVEGVTVNTGAILETQGLTGNNAGFQEIILDASDDDVIVLRGTFNQVDVRSAGIEVQVPSGSTVGNLILNGATEVTGTGTITNAQVNANGVSFETEPKTTKTADGITPPVVQSPASVVPGGGGSSTVAVSGVDMDPTELALILDEITTGAIVATVTPSNATNKTVTWTSSDEAVATVAGGIVTAVGAGESTITATAGGKTATTKVVVGNTLVGKGGSIQDAIDAADINDTIIIDGVFGDASNSSVYTISEAAITIKGLKDSKVFGTFVIKADGVTIDGLQIQNKGGNAHPEKNAISVLSQDITITNNTFTMNPAVVDDIANGLVIWPIGKATVKLNVSNNEFNGYVKTDGKWSSSAFLIAEGTNVPAALDSSTPLTAVLGVINNEEALATGNIYNKCTYLYQRYDYSAGGGNVFLLTERAGNLAPNVKVVKEGATILIKGTIGSTEDYRIYDITKAITIKGVNTGTEKAKVYGTFNVKTDATITNLEILNKGGAHPHKNAINVVGRAATITDNVFTMNNTGNGIANGLVVWATGTGVADLTVTGNAFNGYIKDDGSWASSAFLVVEGTPVDVAIQPEKPPTNDINIANEKVMALANTYNNCNVLYEHKDWSATTGGVEFLLNASSARLKAVLASPTTVHTMREGGTILLADNISGIAERIVVDKKITIDGAGHKLSFTNAINEAGYGTRQGILVNADGVIITNLVVEMTEKAGWQGAYGIQVINAENATLNNYTGTGGDAALLVNGSKVTLTGTTAVSGNEYGGIEVSKGSGVTQDSVLNVNGTLFNTTENYGLPTIWLVHNKDTAKTPQGTVEGDGIETAKKNYIQKSDGWYQTQYYLQKAPVKLEGVTPASTTVSLSTDEKLVLTVDASGTNLTELEIDNNISLQEFSVYADANNPYGSDVAKTAFETAKVTVEYNAGTQTWTIDFGPDVTNHIVGEGGITFYIVIEDEEGYTFGTMYGTTPENTFVYQISKAEQK